MKKLISSILLLSLMSVVGHAKIKYTRVSGGFIVNELDDQSTTLTGLGLNGSFLLETGVLLVGSFEKTSKSSLDKSVIEAGARYIHKYQPNIHILAGADLVKSTSDLGSGNVSDTEIGLKVEAIYDHNDQVNLNAAFRIIDGLSIFGGSVDYFTQENLSFGGEIMIGKNNHYTLDATYWF